MDPLLRSPFRLDVELDGVLVASAPFDLSLAGEASVGLSHRSIQLVRAASLRCCICSGASAESLVVDTGVVAIDLHDAEKWTELTRNERKCVSMRALECDGWVIVIDTFRIAATSAVLLQAVRTLRSASAKAQVRADPALAGARSSRPRFDLRTRQREHHVAVWTSCLPPAALALLKSDAVALARRTSAQGGASFWVGAHDTPRCCIEAFAQGVLQWHAQSALSEASDARGRERTPGDGMDTEAEADCRARCGCEFWVQVREAHPTRAQPAGKEAQAQPSGDIRFHFDRDEQLRLNYGVLEPSFVSTVTYLGDCGAPTVVLPVRHASYGRELPRPHSPAASDRERRLAPDSPHGAARLTAPVVFSFPRAGKHLLFDGRLLHGCPASFAVQPQQQQPSGLELSESAAGGGLRVTVLVNVWLAHRPLLCAHIPTPWLADLSASQLLGSLPPLGPADELGADCSVEDDDDAASPQCEQSSTGEDPEPELRLWCPTPMQVHAHLGPSCSTVRVHSARCWTTLHLDKER